MNISDPTILFCAFRYALGRSTYVVSSVVREIHDNWRGIPESTRKLFVDEILEQKQKFGERGLGMPCDQKDWMSIVERFESESGNN